MNDETKQDFHGPQDVRPYWFPDTPVENLPEGLQLAIETIIVPAYEELVMGAESTMERLAGLSAVHLTHLEVDDQIELARRCPRPRPRNAARSWRRT